MQQNKWIQQDIDKDKLSFFQTKLELPEIVLKILLSRGFNNLEEISNFVNPKEESLLNPFLISDMYSSVIRIKQAIENQEKILIYADRDVDGITSLTILYNTIYTLGGLVTWYIPSDEGYGLSCNVLDKYKKDGINLIVTVDCGISAVTEVEYANKLGIDVIVTDHHEPPQDGLPKAYSIVDPKVSYSDYPFKELAGCGVSFKVSQALMQTYGKYFDKKIAIIGINGYECYVISLINDIIVSEEEKNITEVDFSKYSKVILNTEIQLDQFEQYNIEKEIILIDLKENQKQTAYELLNKYKIQNFQNDGRMLEFFENNVDLVSLGSIADIVPLVNENRILVKKGLELLNKNYSKRFGLDYIFNEYLKNKNISAKNISWNVAPILNAAGRMGNASIAAELLLADNKFDANEFFIKLKNLNNARKELQTENVKQFDILLREQCDIENDNILVVSAKNLMHGVTGIVASQMVKLYGKPVILFIEDKDKDEATGACRSIDGFDIVSALDKTKDILVKFGGHNQAAGFTIKIDKIEEFRSRIKQIAKETISTEMVSKKISVDCEVKITDINKQTYAALDILEPFGASNAIPIFLLKNVSFEEVTIIGQTKEHLKFKVYKDGISIPAVFWSAAKYVDMFGYKDKFDVLFNLDLNRDEVQLIILDVKQI